MSKFRRLTKDENFTFIEMVQAYPPLYDGKLTEYKDKGLITKQSSILKNNILKSQKNKPLAGEQ